MARGGARPGAGRPRKGSVVMEDKAPAPKVAVPADVAKAARRIKMTPLEYMLAVMSDETAEDARRDRMAQAAAPYVHARAEAAKPGKKEQAAEGARTAEQGTNWAGLLQ